MFDISSSFQLYRPRFLSVFVKLRQTHSFPEINYLADIFENADNNMASEDIRLFFIKSKLDF